MAAQPNRNSDIFIDDMLNLYTNNPPTLFTENYPELLRRMLQCQQRDFDNFDFYACIKMDLINRCGIKGNRSVACLIDGMHDPVLKQIFTFKQFKNIDVFLKQYRETIINAERTKKSKEEESTSREVVPMPENSRNPSKNEQSTSIEAVLKPAISRNNHKRDHAASSSEVRDRSPARYSHVPEHRKKKE